MIRSRPAPASRAKRARSASKNGFDTPFAKYQKTSPEAGWADSRVKRNGLSEADLHVLAKLREQRLERGEEAEALPRREIVAEHDLLQLGVAQRVEVEVSGQIAPQPSVRVLDRALLPGGVGVAEPGRHGAGAGEQAVPGEGGVVVERDRGPQARVEPAEDGHHDRDRLIPGLESSDL